MDPFSVCVGVITLFQETYLLVKYVHKTVSTAKDSDEDREDVAARMRWEILVLESFGRCFTQVNGSLTDDSMLDDRWLREIQHILEKLRRDFDDFTKLAIKEDEDYRLYSPWYNQEKEQTVVKAFTIDKINISTTTSSLPPSLAEKWRENKDRLKKGGKAAKWAVWDKERWENAVNKFEKRNAKLKDALQILQATQQQRIIGTYADLRNNIDANRLGLTIHAQLKELVNQPESNDMDLELRNMILISDEESPTIHTGSCEESLPKNGTLKEKVLIEYKSYPPILQGSTPAEISEIETHVKSRVRQLASLLYFSGSSELGTLPLRGLVDQPSQSRHGFVFDFPVEAEPSSPESLHYVIKSPSPTDLWPLAARFQIAQSIAKSLGKFHADGWVHKSIRSQSVVFFKDRESKSRLINSPYLVDFEYSRPESGTTFRLRDNDDERNLYRHPEIQDVANSSFSKLHDIYSLGVVLLEIALWQTARSMLDELKRRNKQHTGEQVNAYGLQEWYISRAKKKVAHLMGASYQSAVLACLESKYKDQTRRRDFPTTFDTQVTQRLGAKQIA